MMKDNQKKIYYFILILLLLTVASALIFLRLNEPTLEEELFSLKSTIDEEELRKMGYIDISNIHQTENEEIKNFLIRSQNYQKAVIKTFQVKDGELYAKIFYSDPELREIRSWTFVPWKQRAIAPDKRFSKAYNDEKDNIVTVILINIKNSSLPTDDQIQIDEVLYSYYQ